MSGTRRLCILVVWLGLVSAALVGSPTPGHATERPVAYVLLPQAASTVASLLEINRPLAQGQRLSAAIERDRVHVWVGAREAPELAVTLQHRGVAGFPAMPVGDTALVPEPGPIPAALLEQVVDRIRKGEGRLPWLRPPAQKHPQRRPLVLRDLLGTGRFDAATDLVAKTADGDVCALAEALRVLEEARDWPRVQAFADQIRARVVDCAPAWAATLFARAHGPDAASALPLADDALARFAVRPLVLEAASAVYMRAGRPDRAMVALYAVARVQPEDAGRLRQLAASVLAHLGGDPVARQAEDKRLRGILERTPDYPVARFVLGVLRHYEADFEESDRLLLPLADTVGGDRLAVYLALNDFNRGRKDAALSRLAAALTPTADDPDVWYARAEILRDEDRKLAIADLGRYLEASGRSPFTSPEKRVRVRLLIQALERCQLENEARCPGPWEHPRAAMHSSTPWPWAVGGAFAFLMAAMWWWRRKRS